jgi:PKD repeat protein
VIASATLDFGDGSSADLGTLASAVNVAHAYSQTGTYTARLSARDVNGETVTATQIVQVLDQASVIVGLQNPSGRTVIATATVTGGTGTQFAWTFETGGSVTSGSNQTTYTYSTAGTKSVSVTVTLSDGRSVTGANSITLP